ncbi:hypothetical protein E3N88_39667 [Mikania micrantha]|uniref:RRM domain-containing protein n=1 Tax=Mikania micrantha TaxID=192012 RepID=A0A5N6LXP7_9ASTR|nr:hypothetical protein E3N88_39667 [Mikania micrantha]
MAGNGMHQYHPQWPPAPAPSAPVVVPPPPPHSHHSPMSLSGEEVRTIFISGLPEDVKERELQNLLRWLPGYEASQDMVFDAESKSVLHTEMAKKNLFVKRGIVADPNSFDQSKRMRTGGDYTHTGFSSRSPFHPPPAPVWGPHGYMAPPPPAYDPYGGYPVSQLPMAPPPTLPAVPVPAPSSYMPIQNTKDNPPCNTLFIGNLGENINEEDLRGLFSMQPGFKQMKVLRQERHTVCFIEFEDVNSATNVHHSLQGAVIPSSDAFSLTSENIFKESIWEKEGQWLPWIKWITGSYYLPVDEGDVLCSLCSDKRRHTPPHRMHIAAVHASIISLSHEKCICITCMDQSINQGIYFDNACLCRIRGINCFEFQVSELANEEVLGSVYLAWMTSLYNELFIDVLDFLAPEDDIQIYKCKKSEEEHSLARP